MRRRDLRKAADQLLREIAEKLSALSREEIARWPEFPAYPLIDLGIPPELSEYHFGVSKQTRDRARIAVEIQRRRKRLLGHECAVDGFHLEPDGSITRFAGDELYA
jgi:hypothetical protein